MHDKPTSRAPRDSAVTAPETAAGRPLLDFLADRFPNVGRGEWARRLAAGLVTGDDGRPLPPGWIIPGQRRLRYRREVPAEPLIPFQEQVLYRDDRILVADKPHFLPVTPSGPWVNECLLYRLERATGCRGLVPLHRLDRETAGLVLFSCDPATRAAYSSLFSHGQARKRYEAVAPVPPDGRTAWEVESRIVKGEPWFRMAEVAGPPNARTRIRLAAAGPNGLGYFSIEPLTGKQHQIRLHMARIGAPILNDRLYPNLLDERPDDEAFPPIQLLARELAFTDPVEGVERRFESLLRLAADPVSPAAGTGGTTPSCA